MGSFHSLVLLSIMRWTLLVLVFFFVHLVSCADTCESITSPTQYTISTDGVLSTTAPGRVVVPIQDRDLYQQDHKGLGLVANLNGGTVRVFFAHHTSQDKRLYWNIEPSKGKTSVQLCIENIKRTCYNTREVDIDSSGPLTIQIKAERDSYIRFSISLSDGATLQTCSAVDEDPLVSLSSVCSTSVILRQTLRLSDYPDSGEWQLELEQDNRDSVSISQVAVFGFDDDQMGVSLWNEQCLSYQNLADLYEDVSGAPVPELFRPEVYSTLQKAYWGVPPADTSKCTLTADTCGSYRIACTPSVGATQDGNTFPAFCLKGVRGDFLFTVKAISTSGINTFVGPLVKDTAAQKTGNDDFLAVVASTNFLAYRFRTTATGQLAENYSNGKTSSYIGIARRDQTLETRYIAASPDTTQTFSSWTAAGTQPRTFGVVADYDLCVTMATTVTNQWATFEDVRIILQKPVPFVIIERNKSF